MSDILEQVGAIIDQTPYQQAIKRCDDVQRSIRHAQIDRKWNPQINAAWLLAVTQFTHPGGGVFWCATFLLAGNTIMDMFLVEQDGAFVQLTHDATLGSAGIIG